MNLGDRQVIEIEKADGTTARFWVTALDQGRIQVSTDGMQICPDGGDCIIVQQAQ